MDTDIERRMALIERKVAPEIRPIVRQALKEASIKCKMDRVFAPLLASGKIEGYGVGLQRNRRWYPGPLAEICGARGERPREKPRDPHRTHNQKPLAEVNPKLVSAATRI